MFDEGMGSVGIWSVVKSFAGFLWWRKFMYNKDYRDNKNISGKTVKLDIKKLDIA